MKSVALIRKSQGDKVDIRFIAKFFAIWFLASVLLLTALWPKMGEALGWDEVDYLNAARQGFISNAFDSTSFNAIDFLRFSWAKLWNNPQKILSYYDEPSDVFILRHTHPPLLQYAIILVGWSRLVAGDEFALHFVQFLGGTILIASILYGYIKLTKSITITGLLSASAIGLIGSFQLSKDLNNHLWIAVSLMASCIAVGNFMIKPVFSRGFVVGVFIGFNFIGLETGLFVAFWAVLAVGVSLFLPYKESTDKAMIASVNDSHREKIILWIKRSIMIFFGFFITVMLLYPGAFIRLSLLRSILVHVSAILKANEYIDVSNRYGIIIQQVFPLVLIGLVGISGLFFEKQSQRWYLIVSALIIGMGYGLLMMKFILNINYIIPPLVIMATVGISVVSSWKIKQIEIIVLIFLIGFVGYSFMNQPSSGSFTSKDSFKDLEEIIGQKQAYIEGGHIVQHYLPEKAGQIKIAVISSDCRSLTFRDKTELKYIPISTEDLKGKVVILRTFNALPEYQWEKDLPKSVKKILMPQFPGAIYEFP